MNVVKIYGGLGNQLFQYAFGKVQELNGTDVRYDLTWFKYERGDEWSYFGRLFRLQEFGLDVKSSLFLEQPTVLDAGKYNPALLQLKNKNFFGYWSYFEYSHHILPLLRQEIQLKSEFYTDPYLKLKKEITSNESVSVHIRRGDYVGREGFYIIPPSYYYRLIREVPGNIYVFSDDLPYCRNVFRQEYFDRKLTFVDLPDYQCFDLMRQCSHNITANSTFSQWAAQLNPNPQKIVITPPKWEILREQQKLVTIVIAYYDRPELLQKTLRSLQQYDPKDFNVVIVDDASPKEVILPDNLPFDVKVIRLENRTWVDAVIAYNTGMFEALKYNPKYVILQGVDCYHVGDLISYVKLMSPGSYVSFGCYSLRQGEDPEKPVQIKNTAANNNNGGAWYNHPIHRPVGYNFCVGITAEDLIKLNGFDERFKDGTAYEDNYFLHQIKMLGLDVKITADPYVYHQWHPRANHIPPGAVNKNRDLYNELIKGKDYRAVHLITPDFDHASKQGNIS